MVNGKSLTAPAPTTPREPKQKSLKSTQPIYSVNVKTLVRQQQQQLPSTFGSIFENVNQNTHTPQNHPQQPNHPEISL